MQTDPFRQAAWFLLKPSPGLVMACLSLSRFGTSCIIWMLVCKNIINIIPAPSKRCLLVVYALKNLQKTPLGGSRYVSAQLLGFMWFYVVNGWVMSSHSARSISRSIWHVRIIAQRPGCPPTPPTSSHLN